MSGVDSFSYAVAFHFGALGQLEERPPNQATAAAANGSSVSAIAIAPASAPKILSHRGSVHVLTLVNPRR